MKISEAVSANSRAIILMILILVAGGIYSAFQLPSGIYPELEFPRIIVIAEAGDLPIGNMLLGITRPIEQSISGAQGLYRIRSRTIRGEAELSLLFLPGFDMQLALQQVQAKISEVRQVLPSETQISVERVTPALFPALIFTLTGEGKTSTADLYDYAQYTIRPMMSRIQGVGEVGVLGEAIREIEVVVDSQKLLAHHVTLDQVEEAIQRANNIEAVGRLNKDYMQFLLLTTSEIQDVESIGNIAIPVARKASTEETDQFPETTPVYIRDIANVFEGTQDRLMLVSGNGLPAAQINVSRQIGGDILQIEKEALARVDELRKKMPPQQHLTNVYDLAEFVRDSIASVRDAILIGCGLSILILLLFLRDWRSTLIAASSIPLTLCITLFLMHLLNQTLNLMSLGGMAVAIGLVVDDAIVVVENIHRHRQMSPESNGAGAIHVAVNEILGAVAGSTFTTVVVFLPLGLMEGAVGQFFLAFSMTLSAAVLISLVLAFTVIPLFSRRFLKTRKEPRSERVLDSITNQYEQLLRKALHHTWGVIAATLLLVGAAVLIFLQLGSGFLPLMDEGSFVLDYFMPSGTSLEESDRVLHEVEKMLKDTPEVDSISRRTGAELGMFATEQSSGDILVRLKKDRSREMLEIMDDLRERIETSQPALRIEFVQILQDFLGDLEGNPEPVEIKIFGEDSELLQKQAIAIAEKVEKVPGVVDLYNGVTLGNPEIQVQVDAEKAQRAGLDQQQVAKQLSDALLGNVITQFRRFDRVIGVRVRFHDDVRFNYGLIRQFPLSTPSGALVPLSSIAAFKEVNGQNELLRENQRQMIDITAGISGRSLGEVIQDVKAILHRTNLPPGYTYEIGGQFQSQQKSFRQLLVVLFVAIMLVLILLVLQFRDFRASLVILSAAPVSLIGAFLMLWITGTDFNVSSFMGLIMLIGLIVKNGIILIEYTFQLREQESLSLEDALVQAGKARLRPILMTTLATLFGLLPLALGFGAGSELQKPLALAVIGGLFLSTFVTLVFVPVALLKLESRQA